MDDFWIVRFYRYDLQKDLWHQQGIPLLLRSMSTDGKKALDMALRTYSLAWSTAQAIVITRRKGGLVYFHARKYFDKSFKSYITQNPIKYV